MISQKKKLTKKRQLEFSKPLIEKIKKAESIKKLLIYQRALNRGTKILTIRNKPEFDMNNFKDVCFGTVLKMNEKYQEQKDIRRFMIQGHPTFCCPISGVILDMGRSFIYKNIILDFKALEKMKINALKEIEL